MPRCSKRSCIGTSPIDRRDAIAPAWEVLTSITDQVAAVDIDDVASVRDQVLAGSAVSARDAIHVAVMRRLGCPRILTFDRGFDAVPGVTRIT